MVALTLICGTAACDQLGLGGDVPKVSAAALRQAATEPEVAAFYEARQWRPAWTDASAETLQEALKDAPRHGLDTTVFTRIIDQAEGDPGREAALTLAAINYANALAKGAVPPAKVHQIYALPRPELDVAAALSGALEANNLRDWLASLAPQDPEYKALSDAYVLYRDLAAKAAAAPIPPGAEIRAGGQDPRVPAIVGQLVGAGYLAQAPADTAAQLFTPEMSDALKSLQSDADLPATGRVDDAAVAALNQAAADRARQLAVNMERRRWLARALPPTRIDVNIASAELVYYRDGNEAWASRAIAGSPDNPTPPIGGAFKQLVVNPPWNVPEGIAAEEILPKGPGYMAANDMYVENGRVVQRPGPKAALGAVKFDMQNRWAIYLHDTPAKSLFASDQRHRSHGCVRVERAVEFARFLANERGAASDFDSDLQSGETGTVQLGDEVPVRLLYHTAYLDKSGRLIFADDVYEWDDRLGQAMGLEPSRRRPVARMSALLGP